MADNGHHPATAQVTAVDDQFGTHTVSPMQVTTGLRLAADEPRGSRAAKS